MRWKWRIALVAITTAGLGVFLTAVGPAAPAAVERTVRTAWPAQPALRDTTTENSARVDFASIKAAYHPSDIRLLDRAGEVIHERRVDARVRRFDWVNLDQVSPALLDAVLRAEDRRFYEHRGVDVRSILAASFDWITGKARRGGSTLTMQLAGMLDPSLRSADGRRSTMQKIRQIRAALRLEASWSKAEIFEAYLNLAFFRGELQGIGAATALLFGKLAHGLTDTEGCVLASLLKGPNTSPQILRQRARLLCTDAQEDELAAAVRRAATTRTNLAGIQLAPHLARQLLGRDDTTQSTVRSSLSAPLQRVALESLQQNLLALRDRNVGDGAVLVADNATGQVLAYVGGAATLSSAAHVDAIRARRQAGSTLKPFLYGLALEQRLLTAASLLEDSPLEMRVPQGLYRPQNYDGRYRGLVSVRTALASSLNVPAVRTLALIGDEPFVQRLRELGFGGLNEAGDFYGPSLALGSADVSLWELVSAYRNLANDSMGARRSSLVVFPEESTPTDEQRATRNEQRDAAYIIADILADRESRATTFGTESALATRYWTAVKTGTSKEMRDNWCIGFSRRYTVGVWVGNLDGEPMHDVSGVAGAAPVWREVMDWLHVGTTDSAPQPPRALSARAGGQGREWFVTGTEPAPLVPRKRPAHIVRPVSGTVVALDPDIPEPSQRLVFEAQGDRGGLRWQVDGIDIGSATPPAVWKPLPGTHSITLVGDGGAVVDTATLIVRGRM